MLGFFGNIRRWINRNIQRKLVFWIVGFWVISLTILSLTIFWAGQTVITNETRTRNLQLASVVSRDINSQISGIFTNIRTFSKYLEASNPDLESQAAAILALRLSDPQRYQAIYYFDANGTVLLNISDPLQNLLSIKSPTEIITSSSTPVGKEVINAYQMTRGKIQYISDVHFTSMDNLPFTYVGVPVSFSGEEARVIVFEIDLRDIWQRIDLSTIGQSGFTYAVSRDGIIIAHPQPTYIGSPISSEIEPLIQGYEGFTQYKDPSRNQEVIAAYSPVGGQTGWGIVVVQDQSEAYAPILRTGAIIIIIWLVLALLGTLGILLMIRNFTKPIVKLTLTTQAIAQTGDLTKTSGVHSPDEVGQLSRSFDQMIERLQKSEKRIEQAAIEERNRLARDLHDAVSQTLFSASLIAEVLPKIWERNQTEGRKRLEEVRQLTRGALAEMRMLLLELRPTALIDTDINDLLRQLSESITGRSRIPVKLTINGQCSLPVEVKVALYRIAQEALNNVAKHAGAQEAAVSLTCSPDTVTLKISDDGHGFDIASNANKSLGMGIIRERANEIQASLSIQSEKGKGTNITVVWVNQNTLS